MLRKFLSNCFTLLVPSRLGRRTTLSPPRQSFKPALEFLEDRLVPSTMWAARGGGPASQADFAQFGQAVSTDPNTSDVYVAGVFQGPGSFQSAPSAAPHTVLLAGFDNPLQPQGDAFVAKYSKDGTLLWAKAMGGSYYDAAHAITVDSKGFVYVTGEFNSLGTTPTSPLSAPAYFGNKVVIAPVSWGGDGFVAKLDGTGNVLWVKQIDALAAGPATNPTEAVGRGIAVDKFGHFYVTGDFEGRANFFGQAAQTSAPAYQTNSFLLKQDANTGNLIWARQFGKPVNSSWPDEEQANCLAVDPTGTHIWVGGEFHDTTDFSTTGMPLVKTALGSTAGFVEKFDALGNSVWVVQVGSGTKTVSIDEAVHGITLDSTGAAYVTGTVTPSPGHPAIFQGWGSLTGPGGLFFDVGFVASCDLLGATSLVRQHAGHLANR